MPSARKHQSEVVRLIVTTRETFPHTPAIMRAMRRVIWRYAAEAEAATHRSADAHRKASRSRSTRHRAKQVK